MRMERCENGHFYDAERHISCPYCSKEKNHNDQAGGDISDIMTSAIPNIAPDLVMDPENSGKADRIGMPDASARNTPGDPGGMNQSMSVNGIPPAGTGPADEENVTVSYFNTAAVSQGTLLLAATGPVVGWLVCISGSNYGRSFSLYTGKNFIGRSPKHDVYLKGDNSVSRSVHAIVTYEPRQGQFYAQSGDSHSLLYVNDEVVLEPVKLNDHDRLSLGETILCFVPFCDERFSWEKAKQ